MITRANNRTPIERTLEKSSMCDVHWTYFDLPRCVRFWKRGQRGVHVYNYLWQIGAYYVGKGLHKEVGFDLIHHVTFGSYWMPSFFAFLPVPFVWGPLGGGERAPNEFYKTFTFRGKIYEWARSIVRWMGEKDPFVTLGARKAKIILVKASETAERLRLLGANDVRVYSESGIEKKEFAKACAIPLRNANPFRIVSVGRLLHWKGFHLGLKAFARFQREIPLSEYWFIGDGPEKGNLRGLAERFGVSDKVLFWGGLPRARVLEMLAKCDVLVHPSLHDSGGWVCLEAMATGRPVICLDLGGPSLQVTKETGMKVPAITPSQAVDDLTQSMCRFARDPDLRRRMGEAARLRVGEYFDWGKKGDWIQSLYQEVCQR